MTRTPASGASGRVPGLVSACFVAIWLIATARPALAWSPGPYGFERCVAEFDTAIGGMVTKVEEVGRKPGGWTLSRAHVEIRRVYRGLDADAKRTSFYFWSATDDQLTIPHSLRRGALILAFLSTDLSPIGDITLSGKTGYFVQFAKANHRGYLYFVDGEGSRRRLRDAIVRDDKAPTLADAERALPPVRAAASSVEGGVEGGVVGGVPGGVVGGVPGGVVGGVPGGVVGGVPGGAPAPSGRLTRGEVLRVMRFITVRIDKCHERALRADPSIGGQIAVKIDIGANGRVTSAKVHRSSIANAAMEACVLRIVRRLRFPAKGPLSVTYPFVFRARAAASTGANDGAKPRGATPRVRSKRVRPTLDSVSGSWGSLSRREIRNQLIRRMYTLKICHGRARKRTPSLPRTLTVEVTVAGDGSVAQVRLIADKAAQGDASFHGCVTRMLKRSRFSTGPATIRASYTMPPPAP